jgi:hypothetical protein
VGSRSVGKNWEKSGGGLALGARAGLTGEIFHAA